MSIKDVLSEDTLKRMRAKAAERSSSGKQSKPAATTTEKSLTATETIQDLYRQVFSKYSTRNITEAKLIRDAVWHIEKQLRDISKELSEHITYYNDVTKFAEFGENSIRQSVRTRSEMRFLKDSIINIERQVFHVDSELGRFIQRQENYKFTDSKKKKEGSKKK